MPTPLSSELERLLPRLRRFARASTADKAIADKCVAEAIEQLIAVEDSEPTPEIIPDQVRLYRAVERVLEQRAGGSFKKQAWRALILVFVEGFSPIEAGWVLGVEAAQVTEMVKSAESQVRDNLSNNPP